MRKVVKDFYDSFLDELRSWIIILCLFVGSAPIVLTYDYIFGRRILECTYGSNDQFTKKFAYKRNNGAYMDLDSKKNNYVRAYENQSNGKFIKNDLKIQEYKYSYKTETLPGLNFLGNNPGYSYRSGGFNYYTPKNSSVVSPDIKIRTKLGTKFTIFIKDGKKNKEFYEGIMNIDNYEYRKWKGGRSNILLKCRHFNW